MTALKFSISQATLLGTRATGNIQKIFAKTAFKGQDLPQDVYIEGQHYKVQKYIPPHVNAKSAGASATQPNFADHKHAAPFAAHLTMIKQSATLKSACAPTVLANNVFYSGCPVYKFESA